MGMMDWFRRSPAKDAKKDVKRGSREAKGLAAEMERLSGSLGQLRKEEMLAENNRTATLARIKTLKDRLSGVSPAERGRIAEEIAQLEGRVRDFEAEAFRKSKVRLTAERYHWWKEKGVLASLDEAKLRLMMDAPDAKTLQMRTAELDAEFETAMQNIGAMHEATHQTPTGYGYESQYSDRAQEILKEFEEKERIEEGAAPGGKQKKHDEKQMETE